MKWVLRSLPIIAIAGLGFWLWTVLHPNPEKVIRNRLESLARTSSISADDSPIVRLAAAQEIPDYFSKDARIIINLPQFRARSLDGRDEISEAAMYLQSRLRGVKIQFLDFNFTLGLEKTTAQVDLTAKITFLEDGDLTAQEFKILLKKIDGQWLITHVETVKPFN